MIKLADILNELNIQPKRSIGSGDQQTVYPYLKDPNYVLKKFDYNPDKNVIERQEIKYYLQVLEKYPKYIANIVIPNKNSKYYFQEKVDVKKAQNDIWDVVVNILKKASLSLKNNYDTPQAAASNLKLTPDIFWNSESWEDIENINSIEDIFNITDGEGVPMDYLFDNYIYKNYSKNIPLVQKLKPIWEVGTNNTQFGIFHEDNLGYDKEGNFKIIDL